MLLVLDRPATRESGIDTRTAYVSGAHESVSVPIDIVVLSSGTETSTVVVQSNDSEGELEIVRPHTLHPASYARLAAALDVISRPATRESVPLPFDPDDYPLL